MPVRPLFFLSLAVCLAGCASVEAPPETDGTGKRLTTTVPQAPPLEARPRDRAVASAGPEKALYEDIGKRYCIGGVSCLKRCSPPGPGCEVRNVYVIRLERPAQVTTLRLRVSELANPGEAPALRVRVDGVPLDTITRLRPGTPLTIPMRRSGRVITVEAVSAQRVETGVEAIVSDIRVFGRPTSRRETQ